ncbi:hypothetical protein SAMN06272721_10530 [Arthrobacter sp. P2b]|nr:hypothetical protein SAMN06272721_10530 [Arthrobacter sp. P2b]
MNFVLKHAPSCLVQLPGKSDIHRDVPLSDAEFTSQSGHLNGPIQSPQARTDDSLRDASKNVCGKAVGSAPAEIVDA